MLRTPSQIIDDKGGPAVVAALVGKKPGAVRAWKFRNIFPREAWPEIVSAFPDLTLERLIEVEKFSGTQPTAAA